MRGSAMMVNAVFKSSTTNADLTSVPPPPPLPPQRQQSPNRQVPSRRNGKQKLRFQHGHFQTASTAAHHSNILRTLTTAVWPNNANLEVLGKSQQQWKWSQPSKMRPSGATSSMVSDSILEVDVKSLRKQIGFQTPSDHDVGSEEDEGLGKSPTHHKNFAPEFPSTISSTKKSNLTSGTKKNHQPQPPHQQHHPTEDATQPNPMDIPLRTRSHGRSSMSTPVNAFDEMLNTQRFTNHRTRRSSDDAHPVADSRLIHNIPRSLRGSISRSASPLRRTVNERTASITRLASDLENAKSDLDKHLANTLFNQALRHQLGGVDTDVDLAKALEHYEMAAKLGHTKSMINAARIYESGPNNVRDAARARELLFLACRKHDVRALTFVGTKMLRGDKNLKIDKDTKRAHELLRKAIKRKSPNAMLQMSLCYMNGLGLQYRQPSLAMSLCKKAAHLGHAGAEFVLGSWFEHGVGVDVNVDQAIMWYTRATNRDHKQAQQRLEALTHQVDGPLCV
eukprot:m.112152 g.112152  ORF g.112152 m.112152 type:complete len:507 (-) comp28172_c0_seq1:159-1679(-)